MTQAKRIATRCEREVDLYEGVIRAFPKYDGSSSALKVDSTGQWLLDASNTTGAPTLYAWPISKTNGESTLGNGVTVPGVLLVSGGNVAVGGMAISPDNKLVAVATRRLQARNCGTGGAIVRTTLLNVGDRVLVSEPWGWHEYRHKPGTVTKKTPSGLITVAVDAYPPHGTISHEVKFKESGWEYGSPTYHGKSLKEFSESVLTDELRRDKIIRARGFLEDSNTWRKLGDDLTLRIYALIKSEDSEVQP